jgi:hypothetical protein
LFASASLRLSVSLDRQSAEALIQVRADQQMQERIEELADKSTERLLTPEET